MFLIVNNETGNILLEGKRVYESRFSAKKAMGYFLKEDAENWSIVEITPLILRVLMTVEHGDS